jgi:DNA-binding CsgD family transcriptional regulator
MTADLNELIDLAYSAAVDDELWRDWTDALLDQLECPGALFWVIDAARFDMCRNHMCFRDRDNVHIEREYLSGPVADDPQMHRVCSVKRSEIYLDVDHVNPEDERTREYLAWQEATCGTRHHITASVVLPDGLEAGVSVHRTAAQGVAPTDVQRQMRTLFPHFARALRLGFRHSENIQQSWWEGLAGDQSKALVLLDDAGRVLRSSPSAEAVFRRDDGLTVRGGALHCEESASDQSMKRAVAHACSHSNAVASGLSVRRSHAHQPYSVSVYPLVQRRRFLIPHGAAALVSINDPSGPARTLATHCKEILGLTPREGDVADLLLGGHSLASLAASLQISEYTARSHLKALFQKTRTPRQTVLVSFVARLG